MGKQWLTLFLFIYLFYYKITADRDCSHEIKRRLLLGKKVMANLDSILKTWGEKALRGICLVSNQKHLVPVLFSLLWTRLFPLSSIRLQVSGAHHESWQAARKIYGSKSNHSCQGPNSDSCPLPYPLGMPQSCNLGPCLVPALEPKSASQ